MISTGCSIANAYCALEAGATHIDTSVLGIGERNGITPLGGFVARMLVADRDYVRSKYDLTKLKAIEDLVAAAVEINVPFNNYITGFCAFTHKVRNSLARYFFVPVHREPQNIVLGLPCSPEEENTDPGKYNRLVFTLKLF